MESFFLSETSKYLYLLFDKDHVINRKQQEFLFSTEGHLFRLTALLRKNTVSLHPNASASSSSPATVATAAAAEDGDCQKPNVGGGSYHFANSTAKFCSSIDEERRYGLPMKLDYYRQLRAFVGVEWMCLVSRREFIPSLYGAISECRWICLYPTPLNIVGVVVESYKGLAR